MLLGLSVAEEQFLDTFPPFRAQVGFQGGLGLRFLALLLPAGGGGRAWGAMVAEPACGSGLLTLL
jgi:hypothetical protein